MRRSLRWFGFTLGTLLVLSTSSEVRAGQVRITVGGPSGEFIFTPNDVSLNRGDHVVWVWESGTHSVTSGDHNACAYDGLYFNSGNRATLAAGTAFSWKSTAANPALEYFCLPHCGEMFAFLRISQSGIPVANFRITEVQTNAAGNLDLIEITNLGDAPGDLGRYRFWTPTDSATVPLDNFEVPAGGRVVVHTGTGGVQAPPGHLYLPGLAGLNDTGNLGLYVPNTVVGSPNNADQLVDFVQWGEGGQSRESVAAAAGLWTAGTFLPAPAAGHSFEFCGSATDRGASFWAEAPTPTIGTANNCTTPALPVTWGTLKIIYR